MVMRLSRRKAALLGGGLGGIALLPIGFSLASLDDAGLQEAVAAFTQGRDVRDGDILIDVPVIAENGFSVPITVGAGNARQIMILAPDNPIAKIAVFHFGEFAMPEVTTRIRLARSQKLLAMAELADGSIIQAARQIEVTVGGCGA